MPFLFYLFGVRSELFIKSARKQMGPDVLLTFDDGPHPDHTPLLLDILHRHQVKAMFFLIGLEAQKFPDIVKRIDDEGHIIGNHTWSHHIRTTFMPASAYFHELSLCTNLLESIIQTPIKYYRPPFGVLNPSIAKAVQRSNLAVVGWSLRSFDTLATNPNRLLRRLKRKVKSGDIILLQEKMDVTMEIIEEYILHLKQNQLL